MLPIFKKQVASPGLLVKARQPDEKPEESQEDSTGIEACAKDLILAVHAHDASGAAEALKSAFAILESQPHEEGPHTYDAQNQKAGEE